MGDSADKEEYTIKVLSALRESVNPGADVEGLKSFILDDLPNPVSPGPEARGICSNMGQKNFPLEEMERIATARTDRNFSHITPLLSGVVCTDKPGNYIEEIDAGVYALRGRNVPVMGSRVSDNFEGIVNENDVARYCTNVSRIDGGNVGVSYYYGAYGSDVYYEPLGMRMTEFGRASSLLGFYEILAGVIGTLSLMKDHKFTHYNLNTETVRIIPLKKPTRVEYPIMKDSVGGITYMAGYPVIYNYESSSCTENGGTYGIQDTERSLYKAYYPVADIVGFCLSVVNDMPGTQASEFAMSMVSEIFGQHASRYNVNAKQMSSIYSALYTSGYGVPYNRLLASITLGSMLEMAQQILGRMRQEASTPTGAGGLTSSLVFTSDRGEQPRNFALLPKDSKGMPSPPTSDFGAFEPERSVYSFLEGQRRSPISGSSPVQEGAPGTPFDSGNLLQL